MKKKLFILTLFALLTLKGWADNWLNSVNNYTEGTEFYVTYMHANTQAGALDLDIALFMAARQRSFVTILDSASNLVIDTFTIKANNIQNSYHSWQASKSSIPNFRSATYYCTVSDSTYNKSIKVVATTPIALYMANSAATSSDASLVLPTNRLGKEYVVQSPSKNAEVPEFAVVAVHDGTTVTILPSCPITTNSSIPRPANVQYQIMLDKGQVYFASGASYMYDVSGTTICADKDVMVINGCQSMYSPNDVQSHVCHVTTPIHTWGKTFALAMTYPQNSNEVKITTLDSTTIVKVHYTGGIFQDTVAPFDTIGYLWDSDVIGSALYIETDHPVVCFQYLHAKADQTKVGQRKGGGLPAATLIAPLEQAIPSAMFGAFQDSIHQLTYYISVICPTSSTSSMKLDGNAFQATFAALPGLPTYSYAVMQISNGAHTLTNNGGNFTAVAYGLTDQSARNQWSYAYNLGMNCQHQDFYLLIDGVRTNMATKCKDNNEQWSYNFSAVTNGDYDSIAWYYDRGRMSGDSAFSYTFNLRDSLQHPIYLLVYRHNPICNDIVVDTITAGVNNAMTYNKVRPVEYYCYGFGDTIKAFEGTDAEVVILADTVPLNTVRTIKHRFDSQSGCDSIVHFRYQVLNPQDKTRKVEICQGSSYTYQGEIITEAGQYVFDMLQYNTCHYNETVNVVVNPVYDIQYSDTICQDELPYIWKHKGAKSDTITKIGITDLDRTLKTVKNCDSIVRLHLVVGRKYNFNEVDTVCDNNLPYLWHGQSISQSGTYRDNNKTIYGCDSNYTLLLTVNPSYHYDTTGVTCPNAPFRWKQGDLDTTITPTDAGTKEYNINKTTKAGCDSTYHLLLTVNNTIIVPRMVTISDQDSVVWDGKVYAGTKYHKTTVDSTIQSSNTPYTIDHKYSSLTTGCDSIMRLIITVCPTFELEERVTTCQYESYTVEGGHVWTWKNDIVGTHDTLCELTTTKGYDSLRRVYVTVYPVYHYRDTDRTCSNTDYNWVGHKHIGQKEAGTHLLTDINLTIHGCDSIYERLLIVEDTIVVPTEKNICDVDTFRWDNTLFAGTKYNGSVRADSILRDGPHNYRRKFTSVIGCDSFMTLSINVYPSYEIYDTVVTCQYESYHPNDDDTRLITLHKDTAGTYDETFTFSSAHGCDSVRHMHLIVNRVYSFEESQTTCSNTDFIWDGHERIRIGMLAPKTYIVFDSLKTVNTNCDSIHILHLTVMDTIVIPTDTNICDIDTFRWDNTLFAGTKYNGSVRADSILLDGPHNYRRKFTSVIGCDSFMTLSINVHPTYEIYDTVVTCQYDSYYPNTEDNRLMTLHKDTAGTYDETFTFSSAHGCDSVRHMHLIVNRVYSFEESQATCSNQEFVWAGHERVSIGRQEPGPHTFVDSLKTVNTNCDSVHILHLTVMDTIVIPTDTNICDIDTFRWDHTLFAGTKYNGSVRADSILLDGPHNYRRRYTSAVGCDSFMTLSINVHPTYEIYDTVETCQFSPYHPNNEDTGLITLHKDTAGVYDETFIFNSIYGCDSVRHMHLTVHPEYTYVDSAFTCCNRAYQWEGHDTVSIGIREVGDYVFYDHLLTKDYGCDSLHILYLSVKDTIIVPTQHTMCDKDVFRWDNTLIAGYNYRGLQRPDTILLPGTHNLRNTYTSILTECDSFMTLSLTINPTYEFYDDTTTCQYSPYYPNKDCRTPWTLHCDTAGEYTDTFYYTTINGCDSIRHLHLIVHPEYTYVDSAFTCSNREYHWEGHESVRIGIRRPGTYPIYDSLLTKNYGCDSVHILYLTVMDTIVHTKLHTMCDNESFLWDGQVYAGNQFRGQADFVLTASSNAYHYEHTYTSVRTNCDSIERLVLTINPTYLTVLADDSICQGETYHFSTKFIPCNVPGTYVYYDSLHSIHNCDSIVKITLRVDPIYSFETRQTICDNITWTWRGHTFTNVRAGDTVVVDRYRTIHGCDSIYTLYLKSISSYLFEDAYDMCDVDTTIWRSHSYYDLVHGTYVFYDSLLTLTGCDSVYKLTLTVHPHYYIHDTLSMCDNETVYLRTHTLYYPIPRTYTIIDTLSTVYGCDSVIETTIIVHPTYLFTDNETICSNQQLLWRGNYYQGVSGIFYDSLKSVYGCDSVYKLIFTVIPAYLFEDTVTICSNESYYFKGQYLRDDGDHHFKYYTKNGCDSEYVIHLRVLPAYFINIYETICANEVYNFRGRTVNQSGVYYDSLKTQSGCDSVFVLHLTVNPTYLMTTYDDSHCQGDTIFFRGKTYTQSGVYYDSLKTLLGCDSVFELQLNMKPSYLFETDTAICDYKTMKWRGYYYSQSGTYYDSLVTKAGCDSVYVLYLQVSPTDYDSIEATICLGDSYMLGSQSCTTAGIYYDTIRNARDFDCKVTRLELSTVEPSIFQTITNPDICADDSMVIISHRLLGEYPNTYSILFDDQAKAQGFKDVIDEPYNGIIEAPVPECIREEWYVRPDNYEITVQVDNGICDPKENEYHGTMMVKYPSWVIEQRWNDVVAALNKFFNGNYEITTYEWFVNGSVVQSGSLSYIYMPGRLSFGDVVYARLTRKGETYSIATCPIVIYDRTNNQTSDFHILITGTPDPHGALKIVQLHADVDGDFFISDVTGKTLMRGKANANIPLELELPYPAGVYFLYFYRETGEYRTVKFMLQ